ncbi:MAG: response regulator transcription factor [Clostridiales Family XIII bacterium]|jgi:DNA-binding response OmpR family regulator|nr:response regulator transcription factor [Clostridiales Family XIII bacterium]
MQERILIIEDDEKIARIVDLELSHEGYTVEKRADGPDGLSAAEGEDFDLILLDIMLPGLSGIEVLRRLRRSKATPVILLTARDEVVDKVLGLDSGADDYITKPFAIEELLARIRACLRKRASGDAGAADGAVAAGGGTDALRTVLKAGALTLDTGRHVVHYGGEAVELTLKEFDLLRCLLENKGMVMTRDVLLDHVWGYDYYGESNAVDVYIRFLRSKIDEKFGIRLITTVRGVGYRIDEGAGVAS